MTVQYDFITGTPRQIADRLKETVDEYTQDGQFKFKIGITNNPEQRFKNAYKDEYDFMVVIYKTTSHENVKLVEKELIADNWGNSDNLVDGGGGAVGAGPYYAYVVITPELPVDTGLAAFGGLLTGIAFGGLAGGIIGAVLAALAGEDKNNARKKAKPKK